MSNKKDNMSPIRAIQVLDRFCHRIRQESLLEENNGEVLTAWRMAVYQALNELLVWQRPFLEALRGIDWPYKILYKHTSYFEKHLNHPDMFVRQQAKLFLELLPFPGQWQRLLGLEDDPLIDDEVKSFFIREAHTIQNKFLSKAQNTFYLKNFTQVLKKPVGTDEKGVLRIFSIPYLFVKPGLLERISTRYFLFVEPPMGLVFRHSWWRPFTARPENCLFGVGGPEDAAFLQSQGIIHTTRLAHGEFLDNQIPPIHQNHPPFDIIFNGTADDMKRKRHNLMLDLLQKPSLSHCTALFLCTGKQANIEQLQDEINARGLENRAHIKSNVLRRNVPEYLAKGKIGVHLSLYENAVRCVYEFFQNNLPCVASTSMAGTDPGLFNNQTGMAVTDAELPEAIVKVLGQREEYAPRRWFLAHTGTNNSTPGLNQRLKQIFVDNGWSWSTDIVPAVSSGASRYLYTSDYRKFAADFDWLLSCINSGRTAIEKEWQKTVIKIAPRRNRYVVRAKPLEEIARNNPTSRYLSRTSGTVTDIAA